MTDFEQMNAFFEKLESDLPRKHKILTNFQRLGVFAKLGRIRGQILVKFRSKSEIGSFQ